MSDPKAYHVDHYHPLLIVISGPSGVGKDAVIQRMKERKLPFHFVVTATTRPPRSGEEHGKDYFFLSKDEFQRMIERDELLEHAQVYKDLKGVPRDQVRQAMESGNDVVMRVDVQGAATIREKCPDALMIFLTAEDADELERRLVQRGSETSATLDVRKGIANYELQRIGEFDYVIVNRKHRLEETVDTIISIIQSEHHRVKPRKVTL
jgi:guanylate kinase